MLTHILTNSPAQPFAAAPQLQRRLSAESTGRQEAVQTLSEERERWEQERRRMQEEAKASDATWKGKVGL